jgi:hypothetical protein
MAGQRHIAMDTGPEQFIEAIASFALDGGEDEGTHK